ncbi:MAG: ABC transporter ATP-binding protein [Dehalococcoidia bacterium]|nr:ABC transporter ATP-binding protein [Dehalococcoidia bacterium]
MAFVEAYNLHKTYRMGRNNTLHALRGVDISIEAGEMVAIMGPSGCGKSTLMHILGLLQPPDRAANPPPRILISGVDVTNLSDSRRTQMRARTMGFVFQSFNLVPTLTALENVALASEYAGQSRSTAAATAREALEWVNLGDRAHHRPTELSGGEQQRVAIARALANRPALILADEPTGNLDSANTAEVLEVLRKFNREHQQTIVLVTHDREVGATCSRVLLMRDGVIGDEHPRAAA